MQLPWVSLTKTPNFKKATDRFMSKNRLEAFSDGVLAIIITIMVLELKVPQGPAFRIWHLFIQWH